MGALASAIRTRHEYQVRLAHARSTTDQLFEILREEALYERPIAERHRVVFYVGHVEAFDWNLLGQRAFGLKRFHPTFDQLFAFGIDPVGGGLPADKAEEWPARTQVDAYNRRLREELDWAIEKTLENSSAGHPQFLAMLDTAIEHRLMHAETLAYMFHRLPAKMKKAPRAEQRWMAPQIRHRMVEIEAGPATLGLPRESSQFGWDNERGMVTVNVPEFAIENHNVTNRQFLLFMQNRGYRDRSLWTAADWAWREANGIEHPAFWYRDGNIWMQHGMFGDMRLALEHPVYVSHAEASAYANWLGRKLPTEEQFHRAAYGTPGSNAQRAYPWGEEAPDPRYGNFDFAHWEAAPCGAHPAGASAFGIHDLVGNGWEWTRTIFAPHPGFAPMPFYPGYSANFFDGKHYVMKGGSSRTAACMLRRSFRNWFQPHYPYVYATFRCVEE